MRIEHHFNASADRVFEALTSEQMCEGKWADAGARNVQIVEQGDVAGRRRMISTREVPINAPGFAKKVLGEWNLFEQNEEWDVEPDGDGVRHGKFRGDIKGAPISFVGNMVLRPEGDGCVNEINIDIEVRVPLIGKKIAAFVEEDSRKAADAERDWLAANI